MTEVTSLDQVKHAPDPHQDVFARTIFGFWLYLMTDCLLFGTLFVTYAVMHGSTFGGPASHEIFSLSTSFIETMVLLLSSFTCGLGMLAAQRSEKKRLIGWFVVTLLLGGTFIFFEVSEFRSFVLEGYGPDRSAFLSSFFTLVGTHGLHVSLGLLWMVVLLFQVGYKGITTTTFRRLVCFNMFWHFLDLVWVFIFSFVYLIGVL